MAQPLDLTTIDRPYDNFLDRSSSSDISNPDSDKTSASNTQNPENYNGSSSSGGSSSTTSGSTSNGNNGSVQEQAVKNEGGMGDVWINTFIRSTNWKPKTQGFTINGQTGYAEFTNVFVSGNIQALTGSIGGWLIGATSITDTSGTTGMSSLVTIGDDIRFWAGHIDPALAPFSVTESGVLIAFSGTIGGNLLGPTSISSPNFISGILGSGWIINNDGSAEFQNISIRGVIKSSVFEKGTISAVNGVVMITKSDILATDMTALDSETVTISGESSFVANEIIRMKDGTNDEYLLVTSAASAPTYSVTRDLAGSYPANANPTWKKGTAVVSLGVGTGTKTGFISLDSTSTNSPFIDIYGRNSNTYTDYTLHARLGWLKGIIDSTVGLNSTDVWGLYSDNVFLKGTIVSSAGKIGGFSIGTDYLKDSADSFGLASTVTSGTDIRFWAGDTFANRDIAPFRIDESGNAVVRSLRRNDFHWFTIFESIDGYTQSTAGTGTISTVAGGVRSTTGTVSGNTNHLSKFVLTGSSNSFTWDKKRSLTFTIYLGSATSDSIFIGCGNMDPLTTNRCLGFSIIDGVVFSYVADGTDIASINLGVTLSALTLYKLNVVFTPGVGYVYLVNDVIKLSDSSFMPSGTTDSQILFDWYVTTDNNVSKVIDMSQYDFWQEN